MPDMYFLPIDKERDYPVIMGWWEKRGVTLLDKAIFPGLGAVACVDGVPVAMSWLYMDVGGALGMIEWTTTNPDAPAKQRLQGVLGLFSRLEAEARSRGCLCVLSMVVPKTSEDRILSRTGWVGFGESDVPHVMFAKRLT